MVGGNITHRKKLWNGLLVSFCLRCASTPPCIPVLFFFQMMTGYSPDTFVSLFFFIFPPRLFSRPIWVKDQEKVFKHWHSTTTTSNQLKIRLWQPTSSFNCHPKRRDISLVVFPMRKAKEDEHWEQVFFLFSRGAETDPAGREWPAPWGHASVCVGEGQVSVYTFSQVTWGATK